MNETNDRPRSVGSTLVPAEYASGMRFWQWGLGCACAVAAIIALVLSVDDPSLTYASVPPDYDDEITVQCSMSGDAIGYPTLDHDASMSTHYEITDGEDVLEATRKYRAEMSSSESADPLSTSRGINEDCARADTARLRLTMWVLAATLTLGVGFAWVSIARSRINARPGDSPDSDAATGSPSPAPSETASTDRTRKSS